MRSVLDLFGEKRCGFGCVKRKGKDGRRIILITNGLGLLCETK
jgi:hypothetical protein